MLSQNSIQKKCPIIMPIVSLIGFLGISIAFLVIVLVNNQLLDDGVFLTFHMETFKSETFKIGVESPAVVCLVAAIIYASLSAISFNPKWDKLVNISVHVVDSIFIPLLLCALVMLNDLLQIIFMTALYATYKLLIYDITLNPDYVSIRVWVAAGIALYVVWSAYAIGWFFNHRHVKRGGGVAQLFVVGLFLYDVFKLNKKGATLRHEFGVEMANRFILLISVFVEEF